MSTTTATTAPELAVTVIGPNGVQQLEVHAAGCADLNRPKYRRSERTDETARSLRDLVESWYADMIGEDGESTWEDFTGEFKVFPCVGHLPTDHETPAPAKRTRKTVAERIEDTKASTEKARAAGAAKKAAKKAAARTPRATVGTYGVPTQLEWTRVEGTPGDGTLRGEGARDLYRVTGSNAAGAWFAEARAAKGGHWVPLAGTCSTAAQAKKLAGWYEAGARWLAYTKFNGVAFNELPKAA